MNDFIALAGVSTILGWLNSKYTDVNNDACGTHGNLGWLGTEQFHYNKNDYNL